MQTNLYVKGAKPGQVIQWNGPKPDDPGTNKWGTPHEPVWLHLGGLNETIYGNPSPDESDTSTARFVIHMASGEYCIGPTQCQGADSLYLQTNTGRPNRKVEIVLRPQVTGTRPYLKQYSWNYTQAETESWSRAKELATIFSPPDQYLANFEMYGIDVDSNFNGQGYASHGETLGFKLHGMQIRANRYTIKGCRFIGSGSNGPVGGDQLTMEAFPLNTYSLEAGRGNCLIEDCEVSGFDSKHGGYATMISVNPFTAFPEVRPVRFFDKDYWIVNPVVTVRNCLIRGTKEVNGFGASGAGLFASNGVLFADNVVEDCGLGSNFDTLGVCNVEIRDNRFINCNLGVQMGTPTGAMVGGRPDGNNPPFMYNFVVHGNTIRIRRNDDRISMDYPDRVKGCLFMLRNNAAGLVIMRNRVWPDEYGTFADWEDSTQEDRYWRLINKSGDDPYSVPGYYGSAGAANTVTDNFHDGRCWGNVAVPNEIADLFEKRMVVG